MFQMKPAAKEGDKPSTSEERIDTLNPVPTPWFQSINALAIFILAPLFAALWTTLARRGLNPSIPTKMALGLVFMCLSMAVMVASAKQEDRPLRVPLAHLPKEIELNDKNQLCENKEGELVPYHAGRLKYLDGQLEMTGVLPDIDAYRMIRDTAPKSYKEAAKKLQEKSEAARDSSIRVSVRLEKLPPSLDIKNIAGLGEKSVFYDPASHSLVALRKLKDRDVKALLLAGGDREFRVGARRLFEESVAFRVSSWWLFWCYILATIGELCLSPVGLSMVSKLAPAKFATMLMGLWLVTNFLANFVAGAFGEIWGKVAPTDYFVIFLVALGIAAVVLFLLVRKLVAMMHGVS
jgi:POT family proton-dependent oligopeptide transporter